MQAAGCRMWEPGVQEQTACRICLGFRRIAMKKTVLILWAVWTILTVVCVCFAVMYRGRLYTAAACVTLAQELIFCGIYCAAVKRELSRKQ